VSAFYSLRNYRGDGTVHRLSFYQQISTTAGAGLQPVPHKQVNEICFFNGMNRITFETYR
jgi:hypothetical protein